ncbi:hypothetical protein FOZ61_006818 [Perkinsus olseni]|uniref:Chloride channel protein n=1 Tax=Perkinsus olseni TaxID=32597 RepID=A0A7J6MWR9_PEROL|nr:hypothetical protein FOZ61_006818 [Perkinsus olseni]KAF4676062.1 hypothetical protein FOL46_007940 [Perkinsus olseni]
MRPLIPNTSSLASEIPPPHEDSGEEDGDATREALLTAADFSCPKPPPFESFDYFVDQPSKHRETLLVGPTWSLDKSDPAHYRPRTTVLVGWLLVILAGLLVGLLRAVILMGSYWLYRGRLMAMIVAINSTTSGLGLALLIWLLIGVSLAALIGALVAYVEPLAGGSGIPDVKSYLNGVILPRLLKFRACALRVLGQIVVVGVGFYAGSEGPMAHLGAIVGAAVAQMHVRNFFQLRAMLPFSSHRIKYEFISIGTAMGVAAAFQAPLGGILFSLEEASTYWRAETTWRAFFGCIIASFTAKHLSALVNCPDPFDCYTVRAYLQALPEERSFRVWEIFVCALIGIFFGLLGALFCAGVKFIQSRRRAWFHLFSMGQDRRRAWRVVEVIIVIVMTIFLSFGLSWAFFNDCKAARPDAIVTDEGIAGAMCDEGQNGGSVNPLAALLVSSRDDAIRFLFSPYMGATEYSAGVLILAAVVIFVLTLLTYGLAIPMGLFIPNIMIGACIGRLIGIWMHPIGGSVSSYAVVGAAGMLAGFSRMTISLTAIVVEITGDLPQLPYIMITVIVAKQVADLFTKGAYDLVLEIRQVPYLEELDAHHEYAMRGKSITYRMSHAPLVGFSPVETFGRIHDVLTNYMHGAFLVEEQSRLRGLVSRSAIVDYLWRNGPVSPHETLGVVELANRCPLTVPESFPLDKGYNLFRQLGLRHLLVTSGEDSDRVVGLVSRKDLFLALTDCDHESSIDVTQCDASASSTGSPDV